MDKGKKEKPTVLFHITPMKNVLKILTGGLRINTYNNGFVNREHINEYSRKYGLQPIFLTTDIAGVIKTQLTERFIINNRCVLLQVDARDIEIEDEYEYLKGNPYPYKSFDSIDPHIFGRDYICRNDIAPEVITVISSLSGDIMTHLIYT